MGHRVYDDSLAGRFAVPFVGSGGSRPPCDIRRTTIVHSQAPPGDRAFNNSWIQDVNCAHPPKHPEERIESTGWRAPEGVRDKKELRLWASDCGSATPPCRELERLSAGASAPSSRPTKRRSRSPCLTRSTMSRRAWNSTSISASGSRCTGGRGSRSSIDGAVPVPRLALARYFSVSTRSDQAAVCGRGASVHWNGSTSARRQQPPCPRLGRVRLRCMRALRLDGRFGPARATGSRVLAAARKGAEGER